MEKRIAILATNGFEEVELSSPKEYLEQQGWKAEIVSPEGGTIKSQKQIGKDYKVDQVLNTVKASDYDALILPGGVINPIYYELIKMLYSLLQIFQSENRSQQFAMDTNFN
jgi:protease I